MIKQTTKIIIAANNELVKADLIATFDRVHLVNSLSGLSRTMDAMMSHFWNETAKEWLFYKIDTNWKFRMERNRNYINYANIFDEAVYQCLKSEYKSFDQMWLNFFQLKLCSIQLTAATSSAPTTPPICTVTGKQTLAMRSSEMAILNKMTKHALFT